MSSESESDASGPPARWRSVRPRARPQVISPPDSPTLSSGSSVEPPRRKRYRLEQISTSSGTSSEDNDDGSDSIVGLPSTSRRCRRLESDESGWTTDEEAAKQPTPELKISTAQDWQSDSSDGESDKCPICLLKLSKREIGTPDACAHSFCADCLLEWSSHVNTCPVDRKEFVSVQVRKKVGGKVIKTVAVKPRRRSSDDDRFSIVEFEIEERVTICEICQLSDSEETMLLCDMCDLGYHMECLNPPLHEIPVEDWFCPMCTTQRIGIIFSAHSRASNSAPQGQQSNPGSSASAAGSSSTAPSTSTQPNGNRPTSTRGARQSAGGRVARKKRAAARRRRRRTKNTVIEYEIRDGEKFPSKTKRVTKKRRKKKAKGRTRTAARRTLVRSSVKGRLKELFKTIIGSSMSSREPGLSNIVVPQLKLFSDGNELDFVSDDEDYGYSMGGGRAAVAVAPRFRTSAIIDAHRQARRKAIAITSPTYASSPPDLLSSIMESQTLLHSKSTSLSVKGDGSLIIETPKHIERKDNVIIEKQEKVNVLASDSSSLAKETPAYGGTGRGGGNWRGGRNDYQGGGNQNRNSRAYNNSGNYQSAGPGNYRENNNYNNESFSSQSNSYYSPGNTWPNNNARNQREFSNFRDRSPQQRLNANNRGRGGFQRFSPQVSQRPRGVPQWQPQNYSDMSQSYNEQHPSENYAETDENNSHVSTAVENNSDSNFNADAVSSDSFSSNRQFGNYEVTNESSQGNVPPQPSIIRFQKPTLSDDENDDSKITTDGDKYDPTEPTIDDSSSEDGSSKPVNVQHKITIVSPPRPTTPYESETFSPAAVQETERQVEVSSEILDDAVQQVLIEHRDFLKLSSDKDENESDSECPNFSIYSSTSMDIVKNKKESIENEIKQQINDDHEDLVQEDDVENDINSNIDEIINEPSSSFEAKEDIDQTIQNDEEIKTIIESEISLSKPQLVVKSKFIPKRNVIKINLSSNLGIKKRIMDSENKEIKNDDVPQCSSTSENDIKIDDAYITNQIERVKLPQHDIALQRESDKFTESISDAEDERSYTPCLDENKSNKSKDTSIEDEKANSGIEGLDTELISEDEGNELFSEHNNHSLNSDRGNTEILIREAREQPGECEEGEIIEKNKQKIKAKVKELLEKTEEKISDDDKKKKRKEKKIDKDDKEKSVKSKSKKEEDMSFKKLTKSGKERNYRDREDKNKKGRDRRRSKSTDKENKERKLKDKKREKRKDMERYDVRNIISDRSRRLKDAFGRDKSRPNSPDSRANSPGRYRSSLSKRRTASRSPSRSHRSVSKRRSPSASKKRSPSVSKRRSPSISKKRSLSITKRRSLSRTNRSRSKSIPPKSPQKQATKRSDDSRRKRSISRGRRSLSNNRKSPSLRNKRSPSPRNKRSPSPRNKRSPSPKRRSVSPKVRKSISPRRRSASPRNRSPLLRHRRSISPRIRRSISPRMRRSISPRIRRSKSLHTRRSISRTRNKRFKRSVSRSRRVSPRMVQRNKSPIRRRLSRRSISRNRSRSPKLKKVRKTKRNRSNSSIHKSKSPIKHKLKRKRLQSYSPIRLSRSMSRERLHHPQWQVPEKSPLFQDWTSGSQSMSPAHVSPGWTPPPMEKSPEPRNLRVILTTKEKTKKKDKKKKSNKRNKASDRVLKHQSKDLGPSKEVFTSGNNILVSLSFNKNKDTNHIPSMMTTEIMPKKKKRKAETAAKQKKDKNREKIKKRRLEKEKRTREIENKKPVAIIDLDKSPFKELTPSPKAVIVLSDSDTEEKEEEVISVRQENNTNKLVETEFPQAEIQSLPSSPSREATYVVPAGPKTPPEPSIKFTIVSKSNTQLRAVNPLHEEEDETAENPEAAATEEQQNRSNETIHKGPNTPPDPPNSPPSSPDAYDPFEPTKSGTPTPERVASPEPALEIEKLIENRLEEINNIPSMSLEAAQKSNLSADDVIQAKPLSPTEKVMALLKSTRANSPMTSMQQIFGDQLFDNIKSTDNDIFPPMVPAALQSPDKINAVLGINKVSQSTFAAVVKPSSPKLIYSTVTPTVVTSTPVYLNPVPRIGVYTMGASPQRNAPALPQKITLPSPTKSSPLKTQPPKMFMNKPSPIKSTPIKPILSKNIITKLPLPTIKPLPQPRAQKMPPKNQNKPGQNGSEVINVEMDMDSPYSPGSSDFGDLFEPPADNGKHTAAVPPVVGYQPQKVTAKYDPFENIFNMKPATKGKTKVTVQQIKKPKKMSSSNYKVDEVSLKILEELPSSAVEMQVKAKYLKKLNRQERVVEEVKVVLKPHYARKHISKEEYKEILRRAVPKICHNRSGEINPAKIHALIEAYVKKFRKKLLTVK